MFNLFKIDSHWIDIYSILFGVVCVAIKPIIHNLKWGFYEFKPENIFKNFCNGMAFALALILFLSAFSTSLLQELVATSKSTLAVCGIACLVSIGREVFDLDI